jgi:GNAT superfamily N-acetyltransferase
VNLLFELSKEQFQCIRHLLPLSNEFVEPKGVIDLNNPGWVFADSLTQPEAAMVWTQGNCGFYLLGKYTIQCAKEINHVIDTIIIPRLVSGKTEYFEFSGVPPVTDMDLENIFKSRKLYSWKQTIYQYNGSNTIPNIVVPHQAKLCDIKDILERNTAENMTFVKDRILNYWESFEAFNAKAYGYCLLVDNIVASLAITGWTAGNVYAISIETEATYRRRGYAKICASSLLNCYLQQGFAPHWECETDNIASANLAESFGFVESNNYLVYGFKVNE